MTRRTQTHITDTLAIREIMSKLPENWLVRGLEERDYGIDLSIELYNGENPTGCFGLIQVKGTSKSFSEITSLSLSGFPTKTLKYAELFPEAFFIFHTSTSDKETYFVWAQKYIEIRLARDNPDWESQDTNTIYFPRENVLGTPQGDRKMEEIMKRLSKQQDGLRFLAEYDRLQYYWHYYTQGSLEYIDACLEFTNKLKKYKSFYNFYTSGSTFLDLHALTVSLRDFKEHPIGVKYGIVTTEEDGERCKDVDCQIAELVIVKDLFLHHLDRDLALEANQDSPY
ncbi:DUF4365 domain-containing protein [Vibrio vulnificus]|uniref:DUF4365 domain-containing protein n=2 Tax=Vibrio vulnificus TaxID=672 RepID=UPI00050324AB|nr:DUF4365 domain-containing protein [Vibrio vulnificus]EJS4046623.1 DUF4365 domain-containing protein [Vibrio vulnificus]KFK53359.1 hypothetical protein JS86_20260 [Vibrio vulnificus]